jgi:membrane associated rhomboid family serine protease
MHFLITYLLIGINVLVFFYLQNQPAQIMRMMLITDRVKQNKEYDRLFLSGFAHADLLHLVFNMLTLYFFGPALEMVIGGTLFLLLFLASIIAGNLFCMFMRSADRQYAALGASGGVLGVIYAFILGIPGAQLSLFILPIFIPGWLFGIIFSVMSIVLTQLPRAEAARISHEGHLGGALAGALFMFVIMLPMGFSSEQYYFLAGGVTPIVLFGLVKLVAPDLLYKHLR